MNERRKERKTTSKDRPKNRAKAKQERKEEKERQEMENEKACSWSMMMKKSPENVASIDKKPPVHF
jgi:hypothetical protein